MSRPRLHRLPDLHPARRGVARRRGANRPGATRPPRRDPPAHDAYARLLTRLEPDPEARYRQVEPLVVQGGGVLVIDDSTLDKFHAKAIESVHRHWSGKHQRVVWGINLIRLVWSDGDRTLPLDYRLSDKPMDGLTKNDHFRDLIAAAKRRESVPAPSSSTAGTRPWTT